MVDIPCSGLECCTVGVDDGRSFARSTEEQAKQYDCGSAARDLRLRFRLVRKRGLEPPELRRCGNAVAGYSWLEQQLAVAIPDRRSLLDRGADDAEERACGLASNAKCTTNAPPGRIRSAPARCILSTKLLCVNELIGGRGWNRTIDPPRVKRMLYR